MAPEGNAARALYEPANPISDPSSVVRTFRLPDFRTRGFKKNKILILEDERLNILRTQKTMRDAYFDELELLIATTSQEATHLLETHLDSILLGVFDYVLLGENITGSDIATLQYLLAPGIPRICATSTPELVEGHKNLYHAVTRHKYGREFLQVINPYIVRGLKLKNQ